MMTRLVYRIITRDWGTVKFSPTRGICGRCLIRIRLNYHEESGFSISGDTIECISILGHTPVHSKHISFHTRHLFTEIALPSNTSSPRVRYSVLTFLYYLCDSVHLPEANKFLAPLPGNFFLFGKSLTCNLVPLDLEIEATLRRIRVERRRKLLQDRTVASILEEETHFSDSLSPDSPSSRESATQLPETTIMADEQHLRITLEDYSSSSYGLRPQTKQLLDAYARGKIKLKTPEEATELIESMSASDHAILRDRTHQPTKKSLLELSSHDALLAQNKLLSKQLEILTETLGKLPTKLSIGQPAHSSILQVTGCTIYGEAHETGQCIPIEENTQEVHCMGNQQRQGYTQGGFSGFQKGQWRSHPGNQFNKDQGGSSNRPIQQGPNIFQRTTKLEETLTQFMQSAPKNLEVQVGQLAKQIADKSSNNFVTNTEKNPKEECKVVMKGSKRLRMRRVLCIIRKLLKRKGTDGKKNDVKGESNQEKEKQRMVKKKEFNDQEKEKEEEKSRSDKSLNESMEVPYPVVPSKKEKDHHLARFLDIFRKLEITMPFGEALQQMPLYSKFLKDMLTRKHNGGYIHLVVQREQGRVHPLWIFACKGFYKVEKKSQGPQVAWGLDVGTDPSSRRLLLLEEATLLAWASWMMGTNQNGKRFYQVKVKSLDVTSLEELGRLMGPLQRQAFRKVYGKILDLTAAEVFTEAVVSLTQYYDQPLRCFTFGDFQMVPTIEEFEEILGCPLGGRKTYLFSSFLPSLSKSAAVIEDSAKELDRMKQTRNGVVGLPRKYLEGQARDMASQEKWGLFADILALLIFGVVLFPNIDGLVDLAAIDAFLAYHHSKESPVVAILADLFDTFDRRCEKNSARIVCCLPALCVWLISHLFRQDTRHPCPLQSYRSCVEKGRVDWDQHLAGIGGSAINWFPRKEGVLFSCGDYPNVPLIRTRGCINYNPALAIRQLGYPMRGAPTEESLSPFVVRNLGAQSLKAIQRVHKAWRSPLRKDKELRGIRNGVIGGYHGWLRIHTRGLDWLPKLKLVACARSKRSLAQHLESTEQSMLAIIGQYKEELNQSVAHEQKLKTIEDKATATASSTVREAEPVLHPALNPGRDRNTAMFGRRYSPQAYPYGLPPDFTPRATPEDLSQAPTFEGQLPPYDDYPGQDDEEGDTHLGPLLHLKDPSPHELPQPNIVCHIPASPTPVKESVPFAEDKGKIEALEERIESGLRKGKFEYASNVAPNNNRRAPVVGTRKKEGDAHAVTTAPTWMKAPQNIQSSYQPNPPNFLIRAGNSLPTQVKGPPAAERAQAQRTAIAAPRPINNTAPGASYKYAQHPPPKDNFSLIPMAYSELWPSLLENHLVVAIPGKVFQPPYPKWYDPGAKCVYHSGAPGHNIDSCISFKYKVQHLISAGWLAFQGEGPNVKTNPLASHGGASVNAVEKDGPSRAKRLGEVFTSRRFIYQSLQAACMVPRGGDERDECLIHLEESHDMETCPVVEELLQRLMDYGQLEVSMGGREEPQICMQSEEKKVPLTPKALNGFEPRMGLGKDCLGNADVVDIKGNPYKYGLGYEPGMPGRRNVPSRFQADRVWPDRISQCFTSAGMVSEEEVAAIEEEFPQDPPSFVKPCHPDSQVGNRRVISQSEVYTADSMKDKAAEGTSSALEYDSHRFRSAEHQQRFEAIKGWSFLQERRVQLKDDEYTNFQEEIARRRWASLVTPMAKFDPDIVLEFYANAWPTEEGVRDMKSWVRGQWIPFDADAISQLLGYPLVLEEGQECEYGHRRNRSDGFDEEAIAHLLCIPGQDFARTAAERRVQIMRTNMTTLTQIWMTLLLSNIQPSDHNSDLSLPKCQLVYAILTRMSIHVAQLIADAIYIFAGMAPTRHPLDPDKSNRALGFPALITGLCQSFGVPVAPSKVIRPPITRAFIEKYCIQRQA
ncbi:hypothetical protein HKD37_11G031463 [Glycine soja]